MQEESEASYQAAFPDHFAAFADVAVLEAEVVPADLEEAGSRPQLAAGEGLRKPGSVQSSMCRTTMPPVVLLQGDEVLVD